MADMTTIATDGRFGSVTDRIAAIATGGRWLEIVIEVLRKIATRSVVDKYSAVAIADRYAAHSVDDKYTGEA